MIFPREKKKDLWRYASRINPCPSDGMPTSPPIQPPPPYSSMSCAISCTGSASQVETLYNNNNNSHPYRRLPNHKDTLSPPPPASDHWCTAPCCNCAGSGDHMLIDGNDQERNPERVQVQQVDRRMLSATTFATMFRNCCGGSTDSTNGSTPKIPTRANATHHPQNQIQNGKRIREDFDALMKQLKRKQMAELLLAVKSRVDPPANTPRDVLATTAPTYLQCILIQCTTETDQEQHVTASRLFFWPGLRSGEELKRLPICPAARDCVYTCCNPLHWYRILQQPETEAQPPPYQRSKMLRLRDADSEEDSQNDAKSAALSTWSTQSSSISSIFKPALFESFTTDGKDHNINSKVWCQIAYWEMAHRVGEFFHARTKAVNIYTDGIVSSEGDSMCLRDLTPAGNQVHSDSVQTTRQKVGLGVTLSLENGDVWIYNRGNNPVFVDSPTLAENLDRVCKVMPGYCLKAFETYRAQVLSMKEQGHHQMGPVDYFSIKISFAKGWGPAYKRQDIMGCPCWLEVHFSHLR
ncbi:mothers against decapentaplegic homolog 6 [Drosophila eugracilis]|uniref:mothers against decapentaplegic homolog 6 n=1 Tax=Drosophila eugracilis TaxID=29029 RepID=UPI001BDA913E|nr:mothers against decapentaplegic homolog 6 [Drosophila eugracilis]XP_041675484.1 mothers against decapentaplegic homolog 6 [Drosophila eugracilis]XP_041675485.1 mothers against decapentaplegic homolog 6 [Drosophila eugracilis]